jgi:hypothetical protein
MILGSLHLVFPRPHPICLGKGIFPGIATGAAEHCESSWRITEPVGWSWRYLTCIFICFLPVAYGFAFCIKVFDLQFSVAIWEDVRN